MSTRSAIGIVNADGTVTAIYCHWDGDLEGVGTTLVEHYTNPDRIHALMTLGDLSVLGANIGTKQDFSNPDVDTCISYSRDRNEDNAEAQTFISVDQFLKSDTYSWCEFFYIFENGEWKYSRGSNEFVPVEIKRAKTRY